VAGVRGICYYIVIIITGLVGGEIDRTEPRRGVAWEWITDWTDAIAIGPRDLGQRLRASFLPGLSWPHDAIM
jgi:hypothetical protein